MFVISLDDIEHTSYINVINLGSKLWDAQWEQINYLMKKLIGWSFDFLNNASSGCSKNLKEPLGIMKELTIIFWAFI
jgi:hypothetical protein